MAAIGPNAVLQLPEALTQCGLSRQIEPLFRAAHRQVWLDHPPDRMVPERDVFRLHQTLRTALPADRFAAVMEQAGRLTANYLLKVRIPRVARLVLPRLPRHLAARLLLQAIGRNSWTFAGSGLFSARMGPTILLSLRHNPLCGPSGHRRDGHDLATCHWHRAVFETLFRALIAPDVTVRELSCGGSGGDDCIFEIDYRQRGKDGSVEFADGRLAARRQGIKLGLGPTIDGRDEFRPLPVIVDDRINFGDDLTPDRPVGAGDIGR